MPQSAFHSLFLILALFLTFIWINTETLANYSLQLTAGLVIFLIISNKVFQNESFKLVESLVSTISVVLITSATGGLSSPFFFLNYFLLFELSLLLEPFASVSLSLGLITLYLFSNQAGPAATHLIILLSLLFMTPLAFFIGQIYERFKTYRKETLQAHV